LADAPLGARHRTLRRKANFFGRLVFNVAVNTQMDERCGHARRDGSHNDGQSLVQPT
jgi:hypothetical protein